MLMRLVLSSQLTAAATLTQTNSIGTVGVDGVALSPATGLTANVSDVKDTNGVGTFAYEWQSGDAAGAYTSLGSATSVYAHPGNNWLTTRVSIRVVATHTDALGDQTALTAGARAVNEETDGTPRVEFVNNAVPAAGATVSVNTSDLSDKNGAGNIAYAWRGENSATIATYILTSEDVTNINAGTTLPSVVVTYTDGLNFERAWTLEVQAIRAGIVLGTDGNVTASVTDPSSIADSDSYEYQWLQSATENGAYTNIPDNATTSTYFVPSAYNAARTFVRLSLSYQRTGDSTKLPALSAPVRVAGIASGAATISGSGTGEGSSYDAVLSELRDVLGRVPDADDVTYQWQTGDSGGGGWQPITDATLQAYALATADFTEGRSFLRVVLADKANNGASSATLTATGREYKPRHDGEFRPQRAGQRRDFRAGGGIFRRCDEFGRFERHRRRRVEELCLDGVSRQ